MESRNNNDDLAAIDREIQNLIRSEDNHKDKGMLLLMQSINRNLTENTFATIRASKIIDAVNTKVEEHVIEFQAWKNTGMGAYKIAMIFGAGVQVLLVAACSVLGWAIVNHLKENDIDHLLVSGMGAVLTTHASRIDYNDRRLDNVMQQLIEIERAHVRAGPR